MSQPLALLNGKLLPAGDVAVPVDDAGFMLGVTIPEQLRTFGGKVFRLEQHLDRLFRGLAIVGVEIPFSRDQLVAFARELVDHNHRLLPPDDDLGLTMFVTPGPYSPTSGRGPMVCMHTKPLPLGSFVTLYDHGQDLVTTSIRQIPAECWPVELKCRSRMHYWLADREARQKSSTARALMLTQDDFVTEASTANLVIYRAGEGIVSPPKESILPGISVATLADLAASLGIAFGHRALRVEDITSAEEVLLCSTSPCVWPVLHVNGQTIGSGSPGPVFQRLIEAWSQHVGIDIIAQARRHA